MLRYLPYVLMFAAVTVVLYSWGILRSRGDQDRLYQMLVTKCRNKVLKELKKQNSLTVKEIEKLLEGTSVRLFYSTKRLSVVNGTEFCRSLLAVMEKQQQVVRKGSRVCLPDK